MTDISLGPWSNDWSDEYVLERVQNAPDLPEAVVTTNGGRRFCGIRVLCVEDTVVKLTIPRSICPEARALDFVRLHTSISVPKVRRYIRSSMGFGCLILEKIEGQRLDHIWNNLSQSSQLQIAETLNGYILQLRHASPSYRRCSVPGPMADTPQACEGAWRLFGERPRGPFPTSWNLMDYMNEDRPENPFDHPQSLVLTHGDLNMRNIILGSDGKLWVIDWEWSGFYPSWFEFVAMRCAANNDEAPMTWQQYIPMITAPPAKEREMLEH